jgi:hypothetical protein
VIGSSRSTRMSPPFMPLSRVTKAPKSARPTRQAEPMAKPLPMAAVVLPAASRASVFSRTEGWSSHIWGRRAGTVHQVRCRLAEGMGRGTLQGEACPSAKRAAR